MADPMYRQIADDLQRKIHSGELKRGGQLPTEIDLREQYSASRNTVRDAIKWLTTRGLVETRPGQGTFVSDKIDPFVTTLSSDPEAGRGGDEEEVYLAEVTALFRKPQVTQPRVEIQEASPVLADALRIKEGDSVVCRHQQRFIDETPYSLQTSFYPMTLALGGATDLLKATRIDGGAVAYIAEKCGRKQAGYRDTISVRAPDANEVAFFRLPPDGRISVFEVYRVGFDEDGGRIRLTITVYPADRNRLLINVGEVPKSTASPAAQDTNLVAASRASAETNTIQRG